MKFQCNVSIFASILIDGFGRKVAHILLVLSFRANQVVDGDGAIVQIDFRQVVHIVAKFGLEDIVRHHRVEHRPFHGDVVAGEDEDVVLDVLSHLQGLFVFEDFLEFVHDFRRFLLVGGDGDIKCLVFGEAEAHSHQFGTDRVDVRGLRV